jgi:hypothetical protein
MITRTAACLIALLVSSTLGAEISDSRVSLEVDVEGKADYKGSDSKTQTRVLNITLSNSGKKKIPGATIKWTIYGHTMAGHDLVSIKSGTVNKDIPVGEPVRVSSERVKISGVREHSVRTKVGKGRRAHYTFKKVRASGHEYYGYSVRVFDRKKLLAESFSQPSIEAAAKPKS